MGDMSSEHESHVLAIEPYYGGSHRAFVDTLIRNSRHRYTLLTLPARKWKWRMRGSAIWFAQKLRVNPPDHVDVIFASDMVSVADLRSLLPQSLRSCRIVCYFHENQLTYPLSDEDERDYQYGFTNITTCLASDEVWFNSASHRDAFLTAVDRLLRKMPDHVPGDVVESIEGRSIVRWPLVESPPHEARATDPTGPTTVLWNHRWEYDKNPELFFRTVQRLVIDGLDFQLVLLGESFRDIPPAFRDGLADMGPRIVHSGFADSREEYWRLVRRCHVVVSTAIQENFGLAVVEAILAGCRPLLPNRLSYPELIPPSLHDQYLYGTDEDFYAKLKGLLAAPRGTPMRGDDGLIDHLSAGCAADRCIHLYDNGL